MRKWYNKKKCSFYSDLEAYTSIVIHKGMNDLGRIIRDHKSVCNNDAPEEEVLSDLLITGVLWKEYGGRSIPLLNLKLAVLQRIEKKME